MQVVSANRLRDGVVVYLDPQGDWVETLASAALFSTEAEIASGLEKAKAAVAASEVIEPFAVPVAKGADGLHAVSLRNAIRELGPTIAFRRSPAATAARRQ